MRDSARRSTLTLRALADAGVDASAVELRPLSSNWLAETYAARSPDLDAILKLHTWDLRGWFDSDPDPRFRTFIATFPLSPFFQPAATPIDAVRGVLGNRVPRVLAEGSLDGGALYTLMTRVRGRRWDPRRITGPGALTVLSRRMGELLRRMHAAPIGPLAAATPVGERWIERCAEILHCLADHLAAASVRRAQRRHDYHLRFHRLIERLRQRPLGPTVLAHNDFHPENLLFDGDDQITGLVDFQLACVGPAALDFRRLSTLDETAFAAGYGLCEGELDRACWLGHFFDMMWHALALVARRRFGGAPDSAARWLRATAHFEYLLELCENDAVRRGPVGGRRVAAARAHCRAAVRAVCGRHRSVPAREHADVKVAIIVVSWNHYETTTRPCLEALRRFTDVPSHLICVDNDSADATRAALRALVQDDPRVEVVLAERNLGWADGSLAGLRRVRADDTHVVLLNSDTVVSPGWLSKLLWHIDNQPRSTVVIPRQDARLGKAAPAASAPPAAPPRRAIEPGTGVAPPPPELPGVLELAAEIERSNHLQSREAPPSGFCLLFHVADRPVVENYLADFARYHSGELDWQAWWGRQRMGCRLALDCYVFHGRGGSGGYYAYDRAVRGDAG